MRPIEMLKLLAALALMGASVHVCAEPSALPTVVKTFNPANIVLGDDTTLTITLNNPNAVVATLTHDLADVMPAHMLISNPAGAGTTCNHGAVTATPGAQTVTLSDDGTGSAVQIPASGSCVVQVRVTTDAAGNLVNTILAGDLQTDHGSNPDDANATLNTTATAPTLAKTFNPANITLGDDTTLTITLSNPDHVAATLASDLVDTLPAGATLSDPAGAGSTCAGGNVVATPGADSVTLAAGAAIPAGGSCVVQVRVTTDAPGDFTNLIAAGDLQTDLGSNPDDAEATLNVTGVPPTVAKTFNPDAMAVGDTSTLTITLHNTDHRAATLAADLVDHLPTHVVVAAPAGAGSTCAGGAIVATPGADTVTLGNGAAIPAAGSCVIQVRVDATSPGTFTNTIAAGALQTDLGDNPDAASATLAATATAPGLSKNFAPTSIGAHDLATLTLTLANSNAAAATVAAPLTDTLPSLLTVANPSLVATTCAGGNVSAPAGGAVVTLAAGAQIPAHGSCSVTLAVTSTTPGSYTNTMAAGTLITDFGANAAPAQASLLVDSAPTPYPPALAKGFAPAHVDSSGSSRLTLALYNANASSATLTSALVDVLPTGLAIADPAMPTTTCLSGHVVASPGGSDVTLDAGAHIPSGSCVIAVSVTSSIVGSYSNHLAAGALQTDDGHNGADANATLFVQPRTDEIFANGFDP
ncbi:MAG: hypothetical protein ABI843_08715 [Dokdonella sp.]